MNINTAPMEADTRVLIDRSLENLGWKFKGKNKNVFVEQPRTERERKKLAGKRPDYVLYSKESDHALIVIEAKRPSARIDDALEQGIGYARAIKAPLVFATDGVFCKAFHTAQIGSHIERKRLMNDPEALALRSLRIMNQYYQSKGSSMTVKSLFRVLTKQNICLRGEGCPVLTVRLNLLIFYF